VLRVEVFRALRRITIAAWIALSVAACAGSGGIGCAFGGSNSSASGPQPIEVVKPTATLPFDRTFTWRPVDGATNYRVVVYNAAGERSFEVHDVRGTSVAVAKTVALIPGEYSWQVIAVKDGADLTQSTRTTFTIK
jgi:hypothetical protein